MKKQQKRSPFIYVGIGIGLCMAACGAYGVYDCMTDTGFWPGIYGMLIFIIVEPVLFLVLGLDILCWFLYKRKCSCETTEQLQKNKKRKQEDEML